MSADPTPRAAGFPDDPPVPPNLGLLVVFSPSFSRWLVDNQQWQNQALQSLHESISVTQQDVVTAADGFIQILSGFTTAVERIMSMLDDVRAAQDRAEATTRDVVSAINVELQQLRDAVAQLGTAPSPAEIAALVARINENTDRIGAAVIALAQDDPRPLPTPAPAPPPVPSITHPSGNAQKE